MATWPPFKNESGGFGPNQRGRSIVNTMGGFDRIQRTGEAGGAWEASAENLAHAEIVLAATAASGALYRDGLGMIASENIVSPRVQEVITSDLHGRYA